MIFDNLTIILDQEPYFSRRKCVCHREAGMSLKLISSIFSSGTEQILESKT